MATTQIFGGSDNYRNQADAFVPDQAPAVWVDYGVGGVPFDPIPQIPHTFTLHPNFPNPFNSVTVARFDLPPSGHVTLRVYDTAGRRVRELVDGRLEAGYHEAAFDGAGPPSGVYPLRVEGHPSADGWCPSGLKQPRFQAPPMSQNLPLTRTSACQRVSSVPSVRECS